jgi:hypothetical protein
MLYSSNKLSLAKEAYEVFQFEHLLGHEDCMGRPLGHFMICIWRGRMTPSGDMKMPL